MNDDRRGLKRSLDDVGNGGHLTTLPEQPCLKDESEDQPKPNYVVYTYVPELCDKVLRGEEFSGHPPNVKCSGCHATFRQKSILDYDILWEEFSHKRYADLQFHQYYGGLCLWCRAPYPGEGHFEETLANPLKPYLQVVLSTTSLQDIVWDYCNREVFPEYTRLDGRHFKIMISDAADENMKDFSSLFNLNVGEHNDHMCHPGRTYMKVRGVENVYFRPRNSDFVPDVKLDYRYWRPEECKCVWTPCECICFAAQVQNIKVKLKIPWNYHYNILCTLWNTNGLVAATKIDTNNYQTFFVYMRYWSAVNPEDEEAVNAVLEEDVWGMVSGLGRSEGVCRTVYKEDEDEVITVHTDECRRRNHPFPSYQCMMNDHRCGRCADCKENKY
jgi:hypothetical protein